MAQKINLEESELLTGHEKGRASLAWTNTAFVVEALVLLVAIVTSIAIFTSLFAKASLTSRKAEALTQAVQLAQNAAEEFSSDPAAVAAGKAVGGNVAGTSGTYSVSVQVDAKKCDAGTLYTAHIAVAEAGAGSAAVDGSSSSTGDDGSAELYSLDVSRYVSEVR